MAISAALLPEFDMEMASTRKFLACMPEDILDWQPHPKSAKLGELADHLVMLAKWVPVIFTTESINYADFQRPPTPETREAMLEAFDENVATARAPIAAATDEQFMGTWTLFAGGKPFFAMPRTGVLRIMVMNHYIHHRAQLGVCYRLNDIPVPQSYGPTADEHM